MKPYLKYKPSGVEWLGEVPEHWGVGNLRRFALMKTGHTPSRGEASFWEDCVIPWFTLADVWQLRDGRRKFLGETKECISDLGLRNSAAELLPAGTVVFSRTASVGFSGIMPEPMATTQDFWNWIPKNGLQSEFLLYCFRALQPEFQRLTSGSTHKTIYQADAASLQIPLPSPDEQRAIAAFLDERVGKVDELVEKKRSLIGKLKEKRSALISRAVTRGLDPDAPLKPSGIDWLGDIPEHWEIKRLMFITDDRRQIMYGIVLPGPNVDDGIPIVKGGDVKPGRLSLRSLNRTTPEIESGYKRSRLQAGDLVFSIRGTVGDAEMVPAEIEGANLTQDAARIAPRRGVSNRWLLYIVKAKAVVDPTLALSLGAAVRGVNIRDLKRVVAPFPPDETEQQAIAAHLDAETAKIDRLIAKVEEAIEKLAEYRSALITAAVTGKIDVRTS